LARNPTVLAALAVMACVATASAFQSDTPAATRAGEVERQREEKASELRPETMARPEKIAFEIQNRRIIENLVSGYKYWRPLPGGLATGSGFAIGPEYYNPDLAGGYMELRASAQLSTKLWEKYRASLLFPNSFGRRLASGVVFTHRNYNSLDYYGPGMDSTKGGRSSYRLEDTSLQGIAIIQPEKKLRAGFMTGYLWNNVGPGTRKDVVSTDKAFDETTAPGVHRQTNFLRYGALAQYDLRDNPMGPKTGSNYVVQWVRYQDQSLGYMTFNRYDIDLQEYFSFLNTQRRLAVRARATFTDPMAGNTVPFFLRPTVGGSDDLRGYRPYRFTDNNALVLNAEYRWEIFPSFDGALFFDAAKVMARPGHLAISQMKGSAGFGFRANVRNQTFLRLDVGFSREGFMVWFKFNDVFNSQPYGTGTFQPLH
jgi:outer membrane protein assembly factor BamA